MSSNELIALAGILVATGAITWLLKFFYDSIGHK